MRRRHVGFFGPLIFSLVLTGFAANVFCAAMLGESYPSLASVDRVFLNPGSSTLIQPLSAEGLILLPLEDCTFSINNQDFTIARGAFKQIRGSRDVKVGSSPGAAAQLLVVKVKMATQGLTINPVRLKSAQGLDDASGRNMTLLIALSPVHLSDVVNLGDESQWHPSKPRTIVLRKGQTQWLRAGIHHLQNSGGQLADFITVEW